MRLGTLGILGTPAILIGSLLSTAAWPAGLQVSITSWRQIEPGSTTNTAAEACGTVTGGTLTGQERILLTVDPGGNPGEYTTLLSPSGNFCAVVSSLTGNIEADLFMPGQTAPTSIVRAQLRHP